jgi:CheY-like chemotaxis protein
MTLLTGKRVFVVEDEPLILMALEDMLEDMGCTLAGSASSLADAVQMAEAVECDVAILDLNLNGEDSSPVCDILRERNISFILATGFGAVGDEDATILGKPYNSDALAKALTATLQKR